jgi:hypothetical protein
MTENHGVPGSIPGLATSFYSGLQVKRTDEREPRFSSGAYWQQRGSSRSGE